MKMYSLGVYKAPLHNSLILSKRSKVLRHHLIFTTEKDIDSLTREQQSKK